MLKMKDEYKCSAVYLLKVTAAVSTTPPTDQAHVRKSLQVPQTLIYRTCQVLAKDLRIGICLLQTQ